jgi:hypothetical protein
MKKHLPQIAGVILNLALNISLAKGWADRVPNWLVIVLYVLSVLPLAHWAIAHERTLRHRAWLKTRFKEHGWASVGILMVLLFTIVSTVVVVAPRLRQMVNPSAPPPKQQTMTATSSAALQNGTTAGDEAKAQPITPSKRKGKTSATKPVQIALANPKSYCRLVRVPPPALLYTDCQSTPFAPETPPAAFKANSMNGVIVDDNFVSTGGGVVDVAGAINHSAFTHNEVRPAWPDLNATSSIVAEQLSRLIDEGRNIMSAFLKDDNVQSLSDKDKAWQTKAETTLGISMGSLFADEFRKVQSTSMVYPPGHRPDGESIYDLMDARIAFLSDFMNQLRPIHH